MSTTMPSAPTGDSRPATGSSDAAGTRCQLRSPSGRDHRRRARPGSPPPTSSSKAGITATILEADDVVGGISRIAERDGWRFDIGGHRFFTKVAGRSRTCWHEILPDEDFLTAAPHEPHLLRGQVLRLPHQAVQRPAQPRAASRRSAAWCRTCGCGSGRPRTRPPSRATSSPTTAGGSTSTSSRPTTRRCGACPPTRSRPTGAAQRIKGMSLWNGRVGAAARRVVRPTRRQVQADHQPHRGVPVPQVRARDDVGAVPRASSIERGCDRLDMQHQGDEDPPRRRASRPRSSPSRADGTTDRAARATTSSRRCRSARSLRAMDPPVPAEVAAGRRRPRLPRLPHRRPRRPRGRRLPRQLDLRPLPRRRGRAHPELRRRGRRTWSRTGAPASVSSTSCSRATRCGTMSDDDLVELGKRELADARPRRPEQGRGGLRRAHAEGVSGLRRRPTRTTSRSCATGSRPARRQRAPGRSQRHAQVQQPGPLDVHGDADGREHPRRPPRHLGGQRRRGVPRGQGADIGSDAPDVRQRRPTARAPAATRRSSPRSAYARGPPAEHRRPRG